MDDNYYGSDNPGDDKEIDSMITQGLNRTFMVFNIKPNNNEFIQPHFIRYISLNIRIVIA